MLQRCDPKTNEQAFKALKGQVIVLLNVFTLFQLRDVSDLAS